MFGVEIGYKFTYDYFEYEVIGEDSVSVVGGSIRDLYEDVFVMPDYVYDGDKRYTVVSIADGWGPLKWYSGYAMGGSKLGRLYIDKLYLPKTLKKIGNYGFTHINGLSRIVVSDGVEQIGYNAFSDCYGLDSLWLPASLKNVSHNLCSNCESLKYVYIPESVTEIGDFAFSGCISLESVTIPESITEIGYGIFLRCSSLTSVTIPNSVTRIGPYLFSGCTSLTSVKLPDGITLIPEEFFRGCTSLTDFDIPSTVEIIDEEAFRGSGLGSIDIPDNVTSIGDSAFAACRYLRHVRLPSSLTIIPRNAFRGSMITSITIPEKVEAIWSKAFGDCKYLTDITINATTPPKVIDDSFSNFNATLYVPRGCRSAYERADVWSLFAHIVEKEDGDDAFYLTVVQPSGVVGFKVQEGARQELLFTPDAGFHIHSVNFNGTDITALIESDGTFVTPAIHADARVSVVFEQDIQSVPALRGNSPQVRVSGGTVYVSGCEPTNAVQMYSADGKLLCTTQTDDKGMAKLTSTESGPVIVTTADRQFKLFVRP